MRTILSALVAIGISVSPAQAQSACSRDAMVVFDGSGSMAEMGFNLLDEPRIFDARRAMRTVMPQVAPVRRMGAPRAATSSPGGACRSYVRSW